MKSFSQRNHFCLSALVGCLIWCLTSCDRSGPSQTVIDWDIFLNVKSVQEIDRWIASRGLATHDIFKGVHHSIPAASWFNATAQISNDAIPETLMIGPVAEVASPIPYSTATAVEEFEHPVYFVLRDRITGVELAKREIRPGQVVFKTFLDSTGNGEAGFLYRGNLLLAVDLDFNRGRHQSVTISVQTQNTNKAKKPSLFGQ